MKNLADVPPEMKQLFEKAEQYVSQYFSKLKYLPDEGTIDIKGERYILIRAASMSVELFKTLSRLYQEQDKSSNIVKNLLFDIAHAIGKSDAAFFHSQHDVNDPIAKLSTGPIHFAHAGWATVNIKPESNPVADESFYLIYDHPFSFESDSWLKTKLQSDCPVCFMNAGYSSGWCEQSFGIDLIAIEVMCRASGDDCCRFIMAHPDKIKEHLTRYQLSQEPTVQKRLKYSIPGLLQRKEIEHKLRQTERRHKMLFEYANDAIFILENEKITQLNSYGINILGVLEEDIAGKSILDISPRVQTNNQVSKTIWKQKYELACAGKPSIFEWQFKKVDGSMLDTEISLKLIDSNRSLLQAICRDISHRKSLESQLIQSQKMQAVGTMANGIAHDFNNILSGMMGFTSLLKINLPKNDLNLRYLGRIEGAVKQAADLTRQLLSFSKKSPFRMVPLNPNEHILNVMKIIERTFESMIEIQTDLFPDIMAIEGDSSQFEQMIMNLFLNAAHAMPDGGALKVITRMADRKELELAQIAEHFSGSVVCIDVIDEGIGMSQDVLDRVFEPYFSARPDGSGSGLGMLIVYNILNSLNGHATIDSKPGAGTQVRLFLPATSKPVLKHTVILEGMHPGTETILIVDDENLITDFMKELLSPLGYHVHVAQDGLEALDVFKANSETIDLVIVNTGIPKMDGYKTVENMREIHPELRVILTSGLPFAHDMKRNLRKKGVHGFIQKPFQPETLCKLIRNVLD
jgi:PAS domain S-box-containing protein